MTIRITPGKFCEHLDSWGAGGFSLERSRLKYKDLGLDESGPTAHGSEAPSEQCLQFGGTCMGNQPLFRLILGMSGSASG